MPGDEVRLRFEMGLDGCNGLVGWFVDDVRVFACTSMDLAAFALMPDCLSGPDVPLPHECDTYDLDPDGDVDLADFAAFQTLFTGSR